MIILIILGMALVTIIPRILPAFIIERIVVKDWMGRWLQAIPYAALGALIFPGILTVKESEPFVGIIGGLVAIVLAYFGANIVFVVLGAIVTVFMLTM